MDPKVVTVEDAYLGSALNAPILICAGKLTSLIAAATAAVQMGEEAVGVDPSTVYRYEVPGGFAGSVNQEVAGKLAVLNGVATDTVGGRRAVVFTPGV
jgi:hypothetical protein